MKMFQHNWDDDCFILHIQLNKKDGREYLATIVREFNDGGTVEESETVSDKLMSHRFMVSRSHPDETGIRIIYPEDLLLNAYTIDDRAFYPTSPFYSG